MSQYTMDMHPLADMETLLELRAFVGDDVSADESRYVAEHHAVQISESSSVEACARTVSRLISVHIDQMNAQFKDKAANRHYHNSIELIQEESKRRGNKKITYTGNIADAHKRLETLSEEIVSGQTPGQLLKSMFWYLLFGLAFLALALYSVKTGSVVEFLIGVINAEWFILAFAAAFLIFGFIFGFFAVGVLMLIPVAVLLVFPGLSAVIVNGTLFLIAGVLLICALSDLKAAKNYRPLSEEEHLKNQERIAEKEALCRELTEYSDIMVARLEIMKKKFTDHDKAFLEEMHKYLEGSYGVGAVYDMFSFLNRYYSRMKR